LKLLKKKKKKPREALGLYIAGNELLWARVIREKVSTKSGKKEEQLHVHGHGVIALPEGCVRAGMLVESQETRQLLKTLRPYLHTPVVMTVPPEETITFELNIPFDSAIAPDARDRVVREELTSAIGHMTNISVHDAVCHYEITRLQATSCHVVATIYPRSSTHDTMRILQATGFHSVSMATMPYSLMRMHHDTDHAYLLVVIEDHGSHIALIDSHTVRSLVTLPLGKKHLRDTIQSFLSTSEAQANQIMDKYGLLPTHREPALLQELVHTLSPVVNQLQSYYRQWHDTRISSPSPSSLSTSLSSPSSLSTSSASGASERLLTDIVVAGSGAYIPGLLEYLTSSLHLKAHAVDVWRLFPHMEEVIPEITWHEALRFAPAIAAAVEVVRE
jgi:Tfp pilus assembly PilM family ATPase